MNIAIEVTPLKSAHQYRGIGFYTKNLIWALKEYQPENEYIFFTRGENLPRNADLVHYPYFDVFNRTLPLFKKLPTVVTIHDLIPIVFPDRFPRGIKGEIKWQWQKLALKSVSAVITDSQSSKKDIHKLTAINREKIDVVLLAPSKEFKKLSIINYQLSIKEKYQLPDIFVLYVGDVNWNKNICGMLKAFHKLKAQSSKLKAIAKDLKLVFIGKAFRDKSLRETREIDCLIDELGIANYILKLGFMPTKDLVAIYNLASVYCQPSFYEGFGLPCLEAMACGTSVVAADIPVLREVCGKAVVYVNPYNVDSIKDGIEKILCLNDSNHLNMVNKGMEQAKKFSWKKVAKKTVEVYEKIVA